MLSSKEVRTRRKHNKVATGCQNCKRRRVKCDESKPACQRCLRIGGQCEGYRPPKARIFEPSKRPSATFNANNASSVAGYNGDGMSGGRGLNADSIIIPNSPSLRFVWQGALLDAFLTIWLPEHCLREQMVRQELVHVVPMSAWSSTAWKLAKYDSFVAQSLLCLTLVIVGVQTEDQSVIMEASRQYQLVLTRFQNKVSVLAQVGYSTKHNDHVASLAAAGFCCSQIEYLLESWSNGDRHLEGMASLLQACGPSCLEDEDLRKIFSDHCVLWLSCSVAHRKRSLYSQPLWIESVWDDLTFSCRAAQRMVTVAGKLPALLENLDTVVEDSNSVALIGALHRMMNFTNELGDLVSAGVRWTAPQMSENIACLPETPMPELGAQDLPDTIARGYASAFMIHASASTIRGLFSLSEGERGQFDLNEAQLGRICVQNIKILRGATERLSYGQYGLVTASPLLFFLDSAWMGCAVLAEHCRCDLDGMKPWFRNLGSQVTSMGYRPLREPWSVDVSE